MVSAECDNSSERIDQFLYSSSIKAQDLLYYNFLVLSKKQML